MYEIIHRKLENEFALAKETLLKAEKICIISHRRPDGDAVGANLGLRMALEALGKTIVSACVDPLPENSKFLPLADTYVQDFNYEDFDVIVSVDCAELKLVAFHKDKPELTSEEKPFINFDHHHSNDSFGTINVVDAESCSTSIIIFDFLKYCGLKIDRQIATALLHGIYFDTGGMMHSNTSKEVFEVCGELFACGADLKTVSKHLFHTTPVNRLRLWGRILEKTYINDEGVVVSAVNQEDYRITNSSSDDTSGVIDYLNAVPSAKYCVLLSEGSNGLVKGSLRTQREDVNLSEIAQEWGGGGHTKASGFGMKAELRPVLSWKVLPDEEEESIKVKSIEF